MHDGHRALQLLVQLFGPTLQCLDQQVLPILEEAVKRRCREPGRGSDLPTTIVTGTVPAEYRPRYVEDLYSA
jgi:hypothetical protein